jgi:hypothetical protein
MEQNACWICFAGIRYSPCFPTIREKFPHRTPDFLVLSLKQSILTRFRIVREGWLFGSVGNFFAFAGLPPHPPGGGGSIGSWRFFPATGAATEIFFEKTATAFSED